uniref:F-box and WD repeat domain containing protein 10B n=1 Tax=Semicossyphus pulcher TaxID=241346 RepID=UPI0037E8EB47
MKSVKFGPSLSACELDCKSEEGCVNVCGMCPWCAFAAKPPGSIQCLWKLSDEFKRRFLVELLLRCKDIKVLESIQRVLSVTSWTLYTYARSRSPTSPKDYPCFSADRAPDGKPLGMDLNEIWDWFNSSTDWLKLRYLYRLFSFCDSELLRMVANLSSVLLVRHKRGFLQFNVNTLNHHDEDSDEDSEDPALMVVPGSLRSVSGVSRYRDFIGCLHVDLSKRILGLLDKHTLRLCQKVCRYWQHLAQETMEEIKLARRFQDKITAMMKSSKGVNIISPTYAKIVEVPVPVKDDEEVDPQPNGGKVRPFEAAYAKIKTKTVQMKERNVYCGAYFTTVLLDKEDPHRVMDYRGGRLMATGSKERVVQLLYVASETKTVSVLKGHVGSIRAVLLCEERHLLITASCDASIRCWNVKTDECVMALYGHTRAVNCLDVHADRLVSGAKDCLVKVWSLQTGKHFEEFHFKHQSSVQSVKINTTTVFSSCHRGLVKIWDMETASLVRVINAHKSSVKCLFLDEWHLLSGDYSGQVMAWSTSCVKECLMTFNHPKEVKSLTLVYLRVITGCADGRIRIFNFLTGDRLREIKAEAETGRILSLHFHHNSILVNATSSVKRYQFAKVFWDNTESAEKGQGDVGAQDGRGPVKSATKVVSLGLKMHDCNNKKPERSELLYDTCFLSNSTKCRAQARERSKSAKESVTDLSEKATSERMKKRGLHHPLTRDSILLRVSAMQRAQSKDEVSINMESNARLRDSWGPHTSETLIKPTKHTCNASLQRPKTCVPILKRAPQLTQDQPRESTQRAEKIQADHSDPAGCVRSKRELMQSRKQNTTLKKMSQ